MHAESHAKLSCYSSLAGANSAIHFNQPRFWLFPPPLHFAQVLMNLSLFTNALAKFSIFKSSAIGNVTFAFLAAPFDFFFLS